MQSILGKVKFPPVSVVLHWPDRWCSYCLQECEDLGSKIYHCPSCNKYTAGRTQIVQGTVHAAN